MNKDREVTGILHQHRFMQVNRESKSRLNHICDLRKVSYNEWNLEELGEYARAQHQAIADSEKSVSPRLLAVGLGAKSVTQAVWPQSMAETFGATGD